MSSFSHVHTTDSYGSLFLTILFLLILINSYIYKYKGNVSKPTDGGNDLDRSQERLSIVVDGMTCSHCKESVESAILSFKSVVDTTIDLATGNVIISGNDLDVKAIKDKITSRGFTID